MRQPLWQFAALMVLAAIVVVAIVYAGVSAWSDKLKPHPTPTGQVIVKTEPHR